MPKFRVIVTGGREFGKKRAEERFIEVTLDALYLKHGELLIVHGHASTGADAAAHRWAEREGHEVEPHKARWYDMTLPGAHRRPGTSYNVNAGKYRNQQMADLGADMCLAFPGGNGTAHMITCAKRAGIPVTIMKFEEEPRHAVRPRYPYADH